MTSKLENRLAKCKEADYVYVGVRRPNPKRPYIGNKPCKSYKRYEILMRETALRDNVTLRDVVWATYEELGEQEALKVFDDITTKWDRSERWNYYRLEKPSK